MTFTRPFVSGVLGCVAGLAATGIATSASAQSLNLRDLMTDLLRAGITLAPPEAGQDHSAHFNGESTRQFTAIRELQNEIARQISSFPVSSSAGGFAYRLDPVAGVLTRPTRSFGPVYSERPYTVGEGKYNVGLSYSRFTFDRFDGLSLRDGDMQLLFTHEDVNGDGSPLESPVEGDVVAARMYVDIDTEVTTFVANYGVNDRLDVGIAIPLIDVSLQVLVDAEVVRLSTADQPEIHQFPNGTGEAVFSTTGSASGVGDVLLRSKYVLPNTRGLLWAFTGDVRLPTGEERNLLGLGEYQVKATVLASLDDAVFAPHGSLGYTLSGGSVSDELLYSAGVDWAVDPKLTLAADVLGRSFTELDEVTVGTSLWEYNSALTGPPVIETTEVTSMSVASGERRNTASLAVGFKLNVHSNFLVTANGLVPLVETGLRDDFASLIGLDYSF